MSDIQENYSLAGEEEGRQRNRETDVLANHKRPR